MLVSNNVHCYRKIKTYQRQTNAARYCMLLYCIVIVEVIEVKVMLLFGDVVRQEYLLLVLVPGRRSIACDVVDKEVWSG